MAITFKQLQEKLFWMEVKESEWHQHPKGNGWVQNSAHVDDTATVEGIVYGDAWVHGDARVYGDARVHGNARVYGNAQVHGNAQVYGDAWVYGNAQVYGNAWVYWNAWSFSPLQIKGSVHFVTTSSRTEISVGCQKFNVDTWEKTYALVGKANGYTPDQIAEYRLLLETAASWLKMKFGDEKKPKRLPNGRFAKRESNE